MNNLSKQELNAFMLTAIKIVLAGNGSTAMLDFDPAKAFGIPSESGKIMVVIAAGDEAIVSLKQAVELAQHPQ